MMYTVESLLESNLGNSRRPKQVEIVVGYILETAGKISPNDAYNSDDILRDYHDLCKVNDGIIHIPDNTIVTVVSQLAGDSETLIYCAGRRKGYYLELNKPILSIDDGCNQIDQNSAKELEKSLYTKFAQWLEYYCDRVKVIADNRAMHQWGNPDILGINSYCIVGYPQIEITSIEVKRDIKDWRRNIFEAVAHTLFAHKVYFAFACDKSEFEKEKRDLLLYAQQFQIGILCLLKSEEDNSEIIEIIPAPTRVPNIIMYQKFLKGISVNNLNDLYHFGSDMD